MAEMDPQPVEPVENPEHEEIVVVIEPTPVVIPVNRPRKVYAGMWGPPEIAAVAIGAMVLLLVSIVYFFWVIPSGRELAKNKSEADRLEAELALASSKFGEITSTEEQVTKIVASIDDFEARFLPLPVNGQPALYQRLNGLIAAYGLVNTTGPDYAPLETNDMNTGQQTEEQKGRAKYRSLYPGVYVSTTVEGSYQNLRRFIREIETGREFVIVSAVELAPADTEKQKTPASQAPGAGNVTSANPTMGGPKGFPAGIGPTISQDQTQARRPQGKTHGETVSLHIEMAAYFRRPSFVPEQAQQ